MEIRVLHYFLTVINEGSISRAANSLHITQPTISRQLKELEEELGKQLFIRHKKRGISLTPEGLLLQSRAQEIITMVEQTEKEFLDLTDLVQGDIYIGGGETKTFAQIAKLAKELQADFPGLHYHLYSADAEEILLRLEKGLLDFALLTYPQINQNYDYLKLPTKDQWGLVLPKTDELAQKQKIEMKDIKKLPLIIPRRTYLSSDSNNKVRAWFGKQFANLNIISTFNLVYNANFMVQEGMGYLLCFDHLLSNDNLVFIPLEPKLETEQYLVWKNGKVLSPAAELFLDSLKVYLIDYQNPENHCPKKA
ncbi:LysR family transcriptional regulator [Streptococcus bovimastitidis]|uniref:LysR family transcriptional regulator n=1 Tax=Streptococcus bovimastitidis TaxID=1856638 RepID=A0A1L8MLL9_9STRE|nr:LysR family transcriptional regulator [Streptococcus bovimastitidis]OJF71657.1 LysR family transcriptional regulator [Streptococcus bovimastitidis]